jgi:hypothetical protein
VGQPTFYRGRVRRYQTLPGAATYAATQYLLPSAAIWIWGGACDDPLADEAVSSTVTSPAFARPDVCNAFPWAQGCTSGGVGWVGLIDITLLADGTHTLNATSKSPVGKRTTTSVQFAADNSSCRRTNGQWLNIESPAPGAISCGALSISGWRCSCIVQSPRQRQEGDQRRERRMEVMRAGRPKLLKGTLRPSRRRVPHGLGPFPICGR